MKPVIKSLMHKVSVLGAGSWGTALALVLARNGHDVRLWDVDTDNIQAMQAARCNQKYLPDIQYPDNLTAVTDLTAACQFAQSLLLVIPSHVFGLVAQQIKPLISQELPIVWATKGLSGEGEILSEVAREIFGPSRKLAILSGPSFAKEVAQAVPTVIDCACEDKNLTAQLSQLFNSDVFAVETGTDMVGVQIGGVVKNVMAIATGMSDGLGYGANTRAALITHGLQEMISLGHALGAEPETFQGLSGVGDLLLTCTDDLSRNRRFGLALGQGKSIEDAKSTIAQVIEGEINANQLLALANRHNISMPITEQVSAILNKQQPAHTIIAPLFN